jgi:hypothetical protein
MPAPMKLLLTCALALLPVTAGRWQEAQQAEQEPVYMGHAFLYRVDLAHGRAAGWIAEGVEDDDVLAEIARNMTARLRRSGRAVEAFGVVEPGAVISVTFVGPPAASHAALLRAGLANAGRLDFRLIAEERDLEPLGTTLAAERERLRSWRAAHAELPLTAFNQVARDAGGPPPALAWHLPRVRGEAEAPPEPLAVLRPSNTRPAFGVTDLSDVRPVRGATAGFQLAYTVAEERREAFRAFTAAHLGRRLGVVLNDRVDGTIALDEPLTGKGALPMKVSVDELRELVFALDGNAHGAPVIFTGTGERKLENVARAPDVDPFPKKEPR